jgi:protoheme IX farnesyltransferase
MPPSPSEEAFPSSPAEAAGSLVQEKTAQRAGFADYLELTKPRLSFLSIVTAIVGYLAADATRSVPTLLALIAGTSFAAGGAAVLNQWWEHKTDAKMARTRRRPIPSGLIEPVQALAFGVAISVVGIGLLLIGTHPLSAALAAFTILSYILVYTPLKKVSVANTIVGAIPGAVPPLIGWSAATGGIEPFGWILFAILFTWQMPHFYAIAWTYRDDYAQAGYRMLPMVDASGTRTALESLVFTLLLIVSSLAPWFLGYASSLYGVVAVGCEELLPKGPALQRLTDESAECAENRGLGQSKRTRRFRRSRRFHGRVEAS